MTEEDKELIREVRGMLTGGEWGNEISQAPVIARNDDRAYGSLVDLDRDIDFFEVWCCTSKCYSHSGLTRYPRYFLELDEDYFMVYMLDRFHAKSKDVIESIILSWAKPYYEGEINAL